MFYKEVKLICSHFILKRLKRRCMIKTKDGDIEMYKVEYLWSHLEDIHRN